MAWMVAFIVVICACASENGVYLQMAIDMGNHGDKR